MNDLRQLYQEVILDHSKSPRNFRLPAGASHSAEGYNPLCGDRQTVALALEGQVIRDIGFQGSGCAISMASASMMTEAVKGRSKEEAEKLFELFHAVVTGKGPADPGALDKLAVFAGVAEFPMRVKCATLCWHTLNAALAGTASKVTTE
jgi:nitrogen fixation NifU-like protein